MPMPRWMNWRKRTSALFQTICPNSINIRSTCPSRDLVDVIKNGTVSSAMETEDLWYVTVMANNSRGYQPKAHGWSSDIPTEKNLVREILWHAFGGGCGAIFLFILACIRSYRIKSKYKKRLNDQVSNGGFAQIFQRFKTSTPVAVIQRV